MEADPLPMSQPPGQTGLVLNLTHNPMAFLFDFCAPVVMIDGIGYKMKWGRQYFQVSPGKHQVKVFFKYLYLPECGANSIDVDVAHDKLCQIEYYMPSWMYAKGNLKQ